MKTEHTPEPWATNGTRIESEHNHGWANDGWIIGGMDGPDAEANVRRIVACVNACAGLPTEVLERYKLGVIGVDYKLTKQQRDKLLKAMIHIQQVACSGSPELGIATNAIASVKEG